jgi:methylated-DNA-[protein]-cysteine S-methyltransferase
MDTPVGRTMVAWNGDDVVSIRFGSTLERGHPGGDWRHVPGSESVAVAQLRAYFDGVRRKFDMPVSQKGTSFQKRVWKAVADIPFGETRSYSDIAAAIGNPAAVRAVGAANGRNDVPIVIPCHRVIGSGGELRGYAGGVAIKEALLAFERDGRWPVAMELW